MKKVKKKEQEKRKKIVIGFLLIVSLALLLVLSFSKMTKISYKTEARSDKVLQYNRNNQKPIEAQGWLRVQGTNIDYPIINGMMDYVSLDEIESDYVWTNGTLDSLPNSLMIFGHNVRNLSANPIIADKDHTRFEQLPSFLYYDFAKENEYIQLTFNDTDYLYKIFAVSIVKDDELNYKNTDYDNTELDKVIKKVKSESIYDYGTDVNVTDKLLSLVTCTRIYGPNDDYELKIDARMIRKGEKASAYWVSRNKNYENIEKVMRGDKNESNA